MQWTCILKVSIVSIVYSNEGIEITHNIMFHRSGLDNEVFHHTKGYCLCKSVVPSDQCMVSGHPDISMLWMFQINVAVY